MPALEVLCLADALPNDPKPAALRHKWDLGLCQFGILSHRSIFDIYFFQTPPAVQLRKSRNASVVSDWN
jgi:hypothetical protein